ncbi:MAG TPA: CTP synthase, partial [bacterium]|nr:CTP synthase [bacterium]
MTNVAKIICITGGVLSSLGKGIASASLGNLLKTRGFRTGIMKLDPYINVDPGTMSPYQHGEVFVTADGAETDLDIGHYERYLAADFTREHSVTTGQIYDTVIRRERSGSYLGATIQVIPHITDEIKRRITTVAERFDVLIVEIGGTVGDIESLPFLEAVRQLRRDRGARNICYLHLTLVPWHATSGEMKTKPTQHSVAALRQIGIHPHVLLCRSEQPLDDAVKQKIALFTDVGSDEVISLPDVDSVYRIPQVLREAGLDTIILNLLELPAQGSDSNGAAYGTAWTQFTARQAAPQRRVRIGLVGKYTQLHDAYKSVVEAAVHAAAAREAGIDFVWFDAEAQDPAGLPAQVDGIIIPGGFGDRGVEGKIAAIRIARESGVPLLGICLGLQCVVIEFARHVCGFAQAHSAEFVPDNPHPVIHLMDTQRGVADKGGTMRLGSYPCRLREQSLAAALYRDFGGLAGDTVSERHRHRFEVNNAYRDRLAQKGMMF